MQVNDGPESHFWLTTTTARGVTASERQANGSKSTVREADSCAWLSIAACLDRQSELRRHYMSATTMSGTAAHAAGLNDNVKTSYGLSFVIRAQ